MSKPQGFVLFLVGIVLGAVFYGIAWGDELEDTAWATVRADRMGPVIGVADNQAYRYHGDTWGEALSSSGGGSISLGTWYFNERYIEDFELADDGRIYVTYREPSNAIYAVNPPRPVPDTIYKDVYGVKDGKIVFLGRQEGRVTPEKVTPEKWEFDEEFCEDCQ